MRAPGTIMAITFMFPALLTVYVEVVPWFVQFMGLPADQTWNKFTPIILTGAGVSLLLSSLGNLLGTWFGFKQAEKINSKL